MSKKFTKWDDFEKELNITEEDEQAIRIEVEMIEAAIKGRNDLNE